MNELIFTTNPQSFVTFLHIQKCKWNGEDCYVDVMEETADNSGGAIGVSIQKGTVGPNPSQRSYAYVCVLE